MNLSFSITVITAPCLGAIIGGSITSCLEGGYNNKNALYICFIVYSLFMGACIPCPFINNFRIMIIVLWVAIFMQGFIEPIMMGIILNTCSPIERPTASSLSILLEMMIGMMPASYVYGLVYELTAVYEGEGEDKRNVSRGGMCTLLFSTVIGFVALLLALILKKRSYDASVKRTINSLKETLPHLNEEQLQNIVLSGGIGPDVPRVIDMSQEKSFK